MKIRRVLFLLLLFVFAAGVVWWCVTLPFSRPHLYRPVPPDALWIGRHTNLAGRWPTISRSPLVPLLLKKLGFADSQIEQTLKSRNLASLLERVAPRETVIGYSPNTAGPGIPGLFAVTWAGRSARLMQAGFYRDVLKNFDRLDLGGGRRGWVRIMKPGSPFRYLSLAVHDGMILACLSDVPDGVARLLHRALYTNTLPAPLREELEAAGPAHDPTQAQPDRGWFHLSGTPGNPRYIAYFLDLADSRRISGYLLVDISNGLANGLFDSDFRLPDTNAAPETLLRNTPVAVILIPAAVLPRLTRNLPAAWNLPGEIVECMLSGAETNRAAFIAIESGEYGGRIMGISVPSLILGLHSKAGLQPEQFVGEHLDRLNAKHRWSLIPRTETLPDARIFILEGTRAGIYSSLGPDERCAVGYSGGWLLFSTNVGTLHKLLNGHTAAENRDKLWWQPVGLPKNAWGHAAIRVPQTLESVANALAVYSLALLLKNSAQNQQTRATLAKVQTWIEKLEGIETLTLGLRTCDKTLRIEFATTGPQPVPAMQP